MSNITIETLACGMPVIVERVESAKSLAVNWLLPAGYATDPVDGVGRSTLLSELIFRGAGEHNSRELSDAFDRLGVRRSGDVLSHHMQLSFAMLGERLRDALPLIASMVREPKLPDDALEPVRNLCRQSLVSLDDDPQHLVMVRLMQQHRPPPFDRTGYGEDDVLRMASLAELRNTWTNSFRPGGAIFSAAGAVDPNALVDQLNELLDGWFGAATDPKSTGNALGGVTHIEQETAQVHIGLAADAPPESHDDSMLEHLALGVLSGGTSGRLFTEVRQKRSLCYSVGASYRPGRDHGVLRMYAGTTPERAQETLDVAMAELHRLREGAERDEFDRTVTQLKSRLVMQGESTSARANSIAGDYFKLGHPRDLEEVAAAIDAISFDELNAYLARREFGPFTLTTLGPSALLLPEGVPATA